MRATAAAPVRFGVLFLSAIVAVGVAAPVASAAPAPSTGAFTAGDGHVTRSGTRGKVNVRELSRHPAATTQRATTQLNLPRPGAAVTATGRRPALPAVSAPPPVEATPTANPPAGKPGFSGLTYSSGPDTAADPPDPYVAAGPDHILQTTNVSIRATTRTGGAVASVALASFFGLPAGFENTDPRVIYDSAHGRWIITEVSWICAANDGHAYGYLDLAVSETADPLGNFTGWFWEFRGLLPDFAALGSSTDKLGFGANLFTMPEGYSSNCMNQAGSSYDGADLLLFDWADVLADGGANGFLDEAEFPTSTTLASPRIATQTPATSPTIHAVLEYTTDGITFRPFYVSFTGSAVARTVVIASQFDLTAAGVADPWVNPPAPQQPGPATLTTSIDSRPTDAIWKGGRLVFVSNHGCDPAGSVSELRTCVRVTELNTNGASNLTPPSLRQDFLIAAEGRDSSYGGIGFAFDGTLHAVWTQSSTAAGGYASSMSTYQLASDAVNTLSPTQTLAAGTGVYPGTRWGDYVGVAQDPQVPNAVWQGNQYSAGAALWETYVSQLQTGGSSYVPITPKRVVDSRPPVVGVAGKFNANAPQTFQVANVAPIPANAIAVTGNVTVVGQTAAGYVSVTPSATSTPTSSTLNFPLGDIRANNFTVPLDSAGRLAAVYKAPAGRSTHVIVDITGYFVAGSANATYATLTPVRVMDTRPAPYHIGPLTRFSAGQTKTLSVAGLADIPGDATAITGNLTVVGQTAGGYLAVTPDPPPGLPTTSTLNFPAGDIRANGLTADLNGAGDLSITFISRAGATTHVALDVTGYYRDTAGGQLFYPLTPGRLMDTRPGMTLSGLHGAFVANSPRSLATSGHWGIPSGATALTGNLTVVGQTQAGFAAITLLATATPSTSSINFPLGDIRANGVTVPINGAGSVWAVYKAAGGKTTHLILDVSGYFI